MATLVHRQLDPPGADKRTKESPAKVQDLLGELASRFFSSQPLERIENARWATNLANWVHARQPEPELMYRALVEQIPAVVFVAYLDEGMSQAYVSPQIEAALGFSPGEWLKDPILWYQQLHPEDKGRWSVEAAQMFLTGKPLTSAYRVLSRQGRVVWFQCDAKMIRHSDGSPWFILGVGFDITELKQTEQALHERTETLRSLSTRLLELQDQERRRIARELHDGVGQCLVALKLNFEMYEQQPREELWAESKGLLEQCLTDIRNLSYLLHPPLLDEAGLLLALKAYVDGFSKRSAIEAELSLPEVLPELPKGVEIAIFRVLQESLTNVIRHAHSKRVRIVLDCHPTTIGLTVEDFGRGIQPEVLQTLRTSGARPGIGLTGMQERVSELGGSFSITSGVDGTEVAVTLPLPTASPLGSNLIAIDAGRQKRR
ncbi:MAG: PAS domain-containing protein [Acidobacteria bacterium]|nr:PAS domain-containing protein [Acidobacteriota bacterium]